MEIEPQIKLNGFIARLSDLRRGLEYEEYDSKIITSLNHSKSFKVIREISQSALLLKYTKPFEVLFGEIKDFLRTISVVKGNLPSEWNSAIFLKKLATIEKYSKLNTKIRHTIVILAQIKEEHLVFNSQISKHNKEQILKEKNRQDEILTKLEQTFRDFIKKRLEKISLDWWVTQIPVDIRKKAEHVKTHDKNSVNQYAKKPHPIDYVDFIDYAAIVTSKTNWNAFEEVFEDKHAVLVKFNELRPIRNAIKHSRNVSPSQMQRLQLYSNDLMDLIEKSS